LKPLLPWICELGESPCWSVAEQALYWVDIAGEQVHRVDIPSGTHRHWSVPGEPGCLAVVNSSTLMVALTHGFHTLDLVSGATLRVTGVDIDVARMRFNDGRCDRQGRFWAGTLDRQRSIPSAGLWKLDRGELIRGPHGVMLCNGLAFSPDGASMYFADTFNRCVYRHSYDTVTGTPGEPELLRRFTAAEGAPDGAAVDAEGGYWVALYEAGRIVRLDERGLITESINVPVHCPTMPCFGGPDLRTLFVTTSRRKRSTRELEAFPHSGQVFCTDVGVAGLPEPYYVP